MPNGWGKVLLGTAVGTTAGVVGLHIARNKYMLSKNGDLVYEQEGYLHEWKRAVIDYSLAATVNSSEYLLALLSPVSALKVAHAWLMRTRARNVQYGPQPRHKLDMYTPYNPAKEPPSALPVLVFVHGGAWCWSDKFKHAAFARSLAKELNVVVLAINYNTYPRTDIDGMVDDVALAVTWAKKNAWSFAGNSRKIFLAGHSAGAHLCVQAVVREACDLPRVNKLPLSCIKGVIGLSGVYDIGAHYDHENTRSIGVWPLKVEGLGKYSPMAPAAGGAMNWMKVSPTLILETEKSSTGTKLPPVTLIHGLADETVPVSSSRRLRDALKRLGSTVELHEYEDMDHTHPVLDLFMYRKGGFRRALLATIHQSIYKEDAKPDAAVEGGDEAAEAPTPLLLHPPLRAKL